MNKQRLAIVVNRVSSISSTRTAEVSMVPVRRITKALPSRIGATLYLTDDEIWDVKETPQQITDLMNA